METFVLALGGNAILKRGDKPNFAVQMENIEKTAASIAATLSWPDMNFIITHGNGPQVGTELLRNQYAKDHVPQLPLHMMTAETQALIGSMLETALLKEFKKRKVHKKICTIITHVLVDRNDAAFKRPTKPIGPFYTKAQLNAELREGKFDYVSSSGSYRRVVASPQPISVVESDAIKELLDDDYIVICCGGGGIPMYEAADGYRPVAAVIDKDLTTQVMANSINARKMAILTETDYVYPDYPKASNPIKDIKASDLQKRATGLEEGSIRPKIEACIRFIRSGGETAYIGNLFMLEDIVRGRSGTRIH